MSLMWLGLVGIIVYVLWWWNELWYIFVPHHHHHHLKLVKSKLFSSSSSYCSGNNNKSKLPPGFLGFPFIGETLSFLWYFKFLKRPDDFINVRRHKYGDEVCMFRTHLFGSASIISYTPSLIKFVLNSAELFMQEWPTVELMGTNSIVAVHGKDHARVRRFVLNAINRPDSIARIVRSVQPLMVKSLKSWAQMGRIKALSEARKVTFENIGKLFVSLEAGPHLHSLNMLFQATIAGMRAFPINIPGFAYHHGFQCRKKLEDMFYKELEKRKNKKKEEANDDLMDGFMNVEDEDGNRLSDKEVVDNIVSFVVAGYTSTSLSSMWAIYHIAKNPTVLKKLREENMAFKKENPGDFITAKDISSLKYTNKVVEETIRMANVASFIFRSAVKDIDYNGYKIPKGWKVIMFLRYVHTNPENFEDPYCFNPDRWNVLPKAGTQLVFGSGERLCVGNTLARVQIATLLHHLSIGYKWELVNPNAELKYLPHLAPVDDAEIIFSKL